MAPTATLSFHLHPLPRSRSPTSPIGAPNSLTGPLALLPSGGVSVGEVSAPIPKGTPVWRGLGLGTHGRQGGSLWWDGMAVSLVAGHSPPLLGVWELALWEAAPFEVITIHRVLLGLPPLSLPPVAPPLPHLHVPGTFQLPPPSHARDVPTFRTLGGSPHPTFRNSLLFIDANTNEVVKVVNLESSSAPPPVPPKPNDLRGKSVPAPRTPPTSTPTSPPSPAPKTSPTPSPGALIAAQVDDITKHMFPGHNLGGSTRTMPGHSTVADEIAKDREMDREERDSSEQMAQLDGDFTVDQFALPSSAAGQRADAPDLFCEEAMSQIDERPERASERRTREGMKLLDDVMNIGSGSTLRLPSNDTGAMDWRASVASTEAGDEGFVTADEGAESRRISSASSWTELARRLSHQHPDDGPTLALDDHEPSDENRTPTPSRIAHPLERTDGDAVLLQFLGSGKDSTLRMRRVTEDEIRRDGLVQADGGDGGWLGGWLSGVFGLKGLGNWLGGWWSSTSTDGPLSPTTAASPPIPLPAPTSYPTYNFFAPSSSTLTLSGTPRPIRRRANGEESSRVSVVFFDNEGFGRQAYVDDAGGGFGRRGGAGGY